jgi:NAD(P)-dependent dehydrogenase (short-subunit alcohol dehydrogenase family)
MKLKDKVALVTGGSQGIGEAIATRFAEEGASVAVVASASLDKARSVCERLGRGARPYVCDVSRFDAAATLARQVEHDYGHVDIVVNGAGLFYATPVGATAEADYDRMAGTNLKGTWNVITHVAPLMVKRKSGKILNIASVAGVMGIGTFAVYCATKAGIIMMTRALACELAPHGINVVCLAPGNTATPMNEDIRTKPDMKQFLDFMTARTPSGRTYSTADDMARIALMLCSDDARAMHGSCVLADEGFSAGL